MNHGARGLTIKKTVIILAIAGTHFAASKVITSIVLFIINSDAYQILAVRMVTKMLVVATKILYFPILSLSLYSRQWFPGYWINVVILLNSLLWATVIYSSLLFYKKMNMLRSG